jgi:hypothetical protein
MDNYALSALRCPFMSSSNDVCWSLDMQPILSRSVESAAAPAIACFFVALSGRNMRALLEGWLTATKKGSNIFAFVAWKLNRTNL